MVGSEASGERSVAIEGDVTDSFLNTGKLTINVIQQPTAAAKPFTIPSPVSDFTGREKEIEKLSKALTSGNGRAAISAIGGMGGVGKSQLAFEVARLLGDEHFPDGRIDIDMQGTGDRPLSQDEVKRLVILAFDERANPPEQGPALGQAYSKALSGRKALLLFDNAKDTAQVKDLAPPAPVAMLVTSRRSILLDGGMSLDLDTLPDSEALALLREVVGPDRGTDEELADIVTACGRLPLAVRAAGAFLRMRKAWSVGDYLGRLRDERKRLDALDVDAAEIDVRATLALSAEQLQAHDPPLHDAWTLLSVFPAGFDAASAVAVWEVDEETARDRLDRLADWSLVQIEDGGRVRLHDLVRLLAEERAKPKALGAARARHAMYYLQVLEAANDFYEHRGDMHEGLALFDAERVNIEAGHAWVAQQTLDRDHVAWLAVEYPSVGGLILDLRLSVPDRIRWLNLQLEAARCVGDRQREAFALGDLGIATRRRGDVRQAMQFFAQALAIAREIGDRRTEGAALGNLGNARLDLGEPELAIDLHQQHVALAREIGDRRSEGNALGGIGSAWLALGEPHKAIDCYDLVLQIALEMGDRWSEANARGNFGLAWIHLREPLKAIENTDQALAIAKEIGDRYGESNALGNLGLAWAQLGEAQKAMDYTDQQLMIVREIGDRRGEANALWNRALVLEELKQHGPAIQSAHESLALMGAIEHPHRAEVETWLRSRGVEV